MAAWPPSVGSTWIDARVAGLTRTVLCADNKRVKVRSRWPLRSGRTAVYVCLIRREQWECWDASNSR